MVYYAVRKRNEVVYRGSNIDRVRACASKRKPAASADSDYVEVTMFKSIDNMIEIKKYEGYYKKSEGEWGYDNIFSNCVNKDDLTAFLRREKSKK